MEPNWIVAKQDRDSDLLLEEARRESLEELSEEMGYEVSENDDPLRVDLTVLSLLAQALDKARAEYNRHRWQGLRP